MEIKLQNGTIVYFRLSDVENGFFRRTDGRAEAIGSGTIYGNTSDGRQVRLQRESNTHEDTVFEVLSGTNTWTDLTYAVYDDIPLALKSDPHSTFGGIGYTAIFVLLLLVVLFKGVFSIGQ